MINGIGTVLQNCKGVVITINGNNNRIVIGKNTIVHCSITITGNNCDVIIGDNSTFRSGSIVIEGDKCRYRQGVLSGIREARFVIQENNSKIHIGDDCMLSHNIVVRTSDSHSILDLNGNRINPAKSVFIGNHVWIAEAAIILKGVHIGNNSIIGYGSICTKDIPSNSIATGVPAKVVKENVNWSNKLL